MSRFWWLVWVKVAVLALVLYLGYNAVSEKVTELFAPYILEETESTESTSEIELEVPEATEPGGEGEEVEEEVEEEEAGIDGAGLLQKVASKVEDLFGVKIDYENMLFDVADAYTQKIIAEADEERFAISESLS